MSGPNSNMGLTPAGTSDIDAFLDRAREVVPGERARGRLIFALDATMSRQPTWDLAQHLQGRMFETAGKHGGLDVQLTYFRGFSECKASRFVSGGRGLAALMANIDCRGGRTQIGKVLRHAVREARAARTGALVFIGDAMEERPEGLCKAAAELAMFGVKAFMFHEGRDARAGAVFREIARLTGGAYAAFDASAPGRLAELLSAAAAYASGGLLALQDAANADNAAARLLLAQMTG